MPDGKAGVANRPVHDVSRSGPKSRRWLAFLALVLTMLFWAGNASVGRAVRDDIPPFLLGFLRWVIAFAIILPFAVRHVVADRAALVQGWWTVLILGVTGVGAFNAFFYYGLHYTTAANASLLQAAIPALVLLFNRVLFGVRCSRGQLLGVVMSTLGVLVIVSHGQLDHLLGLLFGFGDLVVLGGVLVWAMYTSLLRLRPDCHPLSFLAVTFGIGALFMLVLAATEWTEIRSMHWRSEVVAAVLYVAIFPSLIAYGLFNFAVATIGPVLSGLTNTLMPLFGLVLATLFLHEQLYPFHAAGIILITAGIGIGWLEVLRQS